MTEIFCLDSKYSTTRLLTKNKPIIQDFVEDDKLKRILFLPESENRKAEGGLRCSGYFKENSINAPLITVITVVFNSELYVEKTILSVLEQKYENIEYIVIDGGSVDLTVEVIKKYNEYIDYWVSEPDDGIYDAMNKAISLSLGKGLLFLNAGDYFCGNVLSNEIQIPCFFPVKFIDHFGNLKTIKLKHFKFGMPNSHQGILFENKGILYDLQYNVSSDYDYFLRHGYDGGLIMANSKPGYIYYDNGGYSNKNSYKRDIEIKNIISKNFGFLFSFLFFVYFNIKFFVKKMIKKQTETVR